MAGTWNAALTALIPTHAAITAVHGYLPPDLLTNAELALAGVPMVAAYKIPAIEALVARLMVNAPSAILANLVLGENVVPEFLQQACTPQRLAEALQPLLGDTPARQAQLAAFARLDAVMEIGTAAPSDRAAAIVLDFAGRINQKAAETVALAPPTA